MAEGVQYLTISDDESGQRLDNFLIARLKGVPKSMIYRVIRKGEVRVNKGRAKPERKLDGGDIVRIPPVRTSEKPVIAPGTGLVQLLEQAILLDTRELLVINKPPGLAVHGGSGVSLGLIEALRHIYGDKQYLELVHRLDRDTSGCILVAKKRSALKFLQDQFREKKKVEKNYLALVKGRWPNRRKVVEAPLRKNELQSGERIVRVALDGKAARTEFDVVERFADRATLIAARPITGRTHQIRVHAGHAGFPLVGDEKYGDDDFNKEMRQIGFRRLFLHAASLAFELPGGNRQKCEAPLPADLENPLAALRVSVTKQID